MPLNGLISERDEYEVLFVRSQIGTVSQTGIGDGKYVHSATGTTYFVVSPVLAPEGVKLEIGGDSETDEWYVTYTGPGAPLGITWTGSGYGTVEAQVIVEDEKLWNGVIWVHEGTITVYAQGVLELTQAFSTTSTGLGPGYIPFWGIPMKLTGGVSATTINLPSPLPDTYDYVAEATSTVNGGQRYKEAGSGTWVTNPVTLAPGTAPAIPGGCTDPGFPTVSGTNTYDLEIECYSKNRVARAVDSTGSITECCVEGFCDGVSTYGPVCITQTPAVPWTIYEVTTENWSRAGSVWAFPNLEKGIERFNSDYGALWYRTEFPQTTILEQSSCSIDGVVSTSGGSSEVHPYQDEIADNVLGAGPADMEDTFGYDSYDPWSGSASYTKTIVHEEEVGGYICPSDPVGFCGPGQVETITTTLVGGPVLPDDYEETASRVVNFPQSVGTEMVAHQSHAWLIARYWGSWCNPHWSYAYYRDDWEVDGGATPWSAYWGAIGSQWAGDSFITEVRRTKKRNHIVSCPLEDSGMNAWLDMFFSGLRWIGDCRWITRSATVPAFVDLTSDSSSLWDSPDSSLSFTFGGSDITITPLADAALYRARLECHSWTVLPFLYPAICDRILLDWDVTNISEVRAYWVSVTGERAIIEQTPGDGFTTAGVTYNRPSNDDIRYAGSWGQDFGNGAVADTGTDSLGTGQSAAAMADATRNLNILLFQGFQAKYIEFEIELIDTGAPATLEYPRWLASEETRAEYWETRQVVDAIWPDGPGVRIGNQSFAVGNSVVSPPNLRTLGYKQTIIDALCMIRLLLEATEVDGGSPDLTTELTQLYDTFEGQAISTVDGNGISFLLPKGTGETWRFALVNSFSEVPPMAHYPRKERSTSTWLESGDYVQKTWSWAQLTRYIVSANEQLQLWDDAGAVQISATVMSPPSGWFVASHQFATDNDETGYRVQSGSTELAQVRPWHGFFAHVGLEAETAANGNVWHDKSRGNRHVRGYTSKGNLQIERSQNSVPFAWDLTPDVIEDVDWSCGRFDRLSEDQTLWLVCEIAGSIEVFTSTDEGRTFTLSITVASGSKPTLVIGPDRRRHFFWIDGTAIKGRVYDAFGTLLEATFTAVASGVDDQGIAAEVRTVQDGEYRIVLTYVSSGSIIAVESTNSTTFS